MARRNKPLEPTTETVEEVLETKVEEPVVEKVEKSNNAKIVNCTTLNLRKVPEGEVIKLIPVDSTVEVIEPGDIWMKVKFNNEIGYVMSDFVSLV